MFSSYYRTIVIEVPRPILRLFTVGRRWDNSGIGCLVTDSFQHKFIVYGFSNLLSNFFKVINECRGLPVIFLDYVLRVVVKSIGKEAPGD